MKNFKALIITIAFFVCQNFNAQFYGGGFYGPVKVGNAHPALSISSGAVAGLKGVTKVNIIYDYSKTAVGKFATQKEYIDKKVAEYNEKDPAKADRFVQSWYNSRQERFEPKFEQLFNKMMAKSGMVGTNYATDAEITLKVQTVMTEPGFNVGMVKMPSYIDAICTFYDKNGNEILSYFVKNATGNQAAGFDYDVGSRLAESYAKAAKMLAKDLNKKLVKINKA